MFLLLAECFLPFALAAVLSSSGAVVTGVGSSVLPMQRRLPYFASGHAPKRLLRGVVLLKKLGKFIIEQ